MHPIKSRICRRKPTVYIAWSLLLLTPLGAFFCTSSHTSTTRKPNIVIILADDLGYGDLGCYGNEVNSTPNIDRLAKVGLTFFQFYSNAPVCAPARASLLTGLFPQRCNGGDNKDYEEDQGGQGLALDHTTFAELVKTRGYVSGCYGKWHLGEVKTHGPIKQGFDESYSHKGDIDYQSHIGRDGEPDWWQGEKSITESGYAPDLMTEHAIEFIEKNQERPFLLYLPYFLVHNPLQGPKDPPFRKESGQDSMDFEIWRGGAVKDKNRAYQDMVHSLDANIGRIITRLKTLELDNDTVIFFISDNGALLTDQNRRPPVGSNGILRGEKKELFEGGIRVPAIVAWPGKIKPGATTQQPAMIMDVFPTIAALTGAQVDDILSVDGVNLLPLLLDGDRLPERSLFWQSMNQQCIRDGRWKLLLRNDKQYLFDLENDISEKDDLSEVSSDIVKQLQLKLDRWKESFQPQQGSRLGYLQSQ